MATGNEVVNYGMGVSLRLQSEWCVFLSSRGVADPKLTLRSREGNAPLLQFDRCVFRIQPVTALKGENKNGNGNTSRKSSNQGPVVYGRPVHIVHSYSGLYVTIVRKPSESDPTHFRVVLMTLEDAGSACRFKILPRYKIRAEGDALHNNDVIFLQQDTSMLSLHGKSTGDASDDEQTEVTATEKATALELSLYDTADVTAENMRRHKTLMAGSATMLFHRERDSLLTIPSALEIAEETSRRRSMSTMALARVPPLHGGGAGLLGSTTPRQTRVAYPFFKAMKTAVSNLSVDTLEITCNSLWFFEHIDPTIGGPIGANMPCRVRHGVTGKYLFSEENPLTKEFEVGIRDLETVDHYDASVFELELVASSVHSIEIYSEKSFVVARHQMTGRYLTTSKNGPHGALLGLTPHLNLEDTLAVVTVPREKQQELTFLIGNVEFLTKYIRKFYAMQSPSSKETVKDASVAKVVARATESLTALIRFCTESADDDPLSREGLALSDHQESMFQVSLHKIAMEVLLCPFVDAAKENKMELPLKGGVLSMEDVLKDEYANVHTVCRLCYRLLKQMSKSSRHAALLIDYVDFMQAQEGYKLHVADTLMEIFTDNPNLPPERCETDIRHFVSLLLKKGRSSGYLKFLSRLCVVNDTGVAPNQRLVAHLVLDKYRNDILYQTAIREHTLMILLPKFVKKSEGKDKKKDKGDKKDKGGEGEEKKEKKEKSDKKDDEPPVWVPLGQFLSEGDSKMVKFFEASVELLGTLCIGADEECLRLASQIMPVDELLVAIDPSFPASYPLRSSYFTLALHLYLRKMLFNTMKVNNRLMNRTTCGSLVLSKSVEVEASMIVKSDNKALTVDEQAALAGEDRVMTIIKRRALEYLQACRRTLVDPGATRLVSTISTIWHTFVSYSQYTKQEALDLVEAVIGVMDSRDDENRYVKNEFTIITMAAKRSLCQFLLNVLKHDVSELADTTVSKLVDTGFDDAVKVCEDGVAYLQTRLFNLPKVLPVLVDLLAYHDQALVSSALELITAVCNVGATVAEQIGNAEPIRTVAAGRAFKVFLAAQSALQQNLSVSGHIIDEQATIDIVSAIVNIDSAKIFRNDTLTAPVVLNDSLIRPPSESGGRLKAKVSSIMAVARIFTSVKEKRQKWRTDDPNSREVARLLFRSEVHRNLQICLENAASGSKIQQALLEFFRILSIDRRGAADIAKYLPIFEKCVFNDATCMDAAATLFNIVKHNRRLAVTVSEDTINHLVTLLSVRHEAQLAEGLEAMVLGDSPVERNQKQVLAQLISLKLLVEVGGLRPDWSSQQMALNSSVVNLMACCCVDNATCRASVTKVLRADDVIRILIANQTIVDGKAIDSVPTAHLTPYLKYLAAAPLSVDSEITAQELTMLRKQWTENASWWTLVSAVFFPRLAIPEGGFTAVEQEEYVFDGILLAMTSYLSNLYDPQVALKARYSTPIADIATRMIKFASDVARNAAALKPRFLLTTIAMLRAIKRCAKLSLAQFDSLQHEFTNLKTIYADRQQEAATRDQAVTIERAAEFASRWEKNSSSALAPLTSAIVGGGHDARIYDATIERPDYYELHKKLVNHLFRKELSDEATIGIFSVLKHSVACLEDKGEDIFAKGQLYLNDIGALRVVTEIISSCSEAVAQEAFNLAIVILEGGNSDVQNSLLSHFMSTDERFFHDIGRMITAGVQQSRNRRTRELHAAFYGDEIAGTSFGHSKHIQEVFRFLQLMCEGHHDGLQNYLRDQDDNLRSVNVVKEVLSLTMELVRSYDGTESSLLQQALALLTEVCQGPCAGNQDLLTQNGTCAMLNNVLTAPEFAVVPPYDSDVASNLLQLKRGAITTLLALLEGVRDETIPLIVFNEVPVAGLEALIDQFIGTTEFAEASNEDLCELVFSAVITLHSLVQCVSNVTNRDRIAAQQVLAKHEHRVGRLGLIEIERNNQLENVYFRVPNICSLLTEDSKQHLLWSVDRSTQGSKLSDFLDKVDELIYDIEATHRVKEQMGNSRLLAVLSKVSINTWDDISLAIAMLINILFVAVISDAKGLLDKDIEWLGVEGFIRVLAMAQCVSTTVIMVLDGITNFPLVLYKQSKEIENPRWYHKAMAIIKRKETLMRFFAFGFAVVGFFFNDFFFAIHLLGLISKSSVLKNVVVAVTQNGKSLLLTAMLGCIIIYLFSLIGFVVFQDHFEDACGTLSQCVVHILSTGLRQGGGIGDAMSDVKYGDPNYYGRLLYDGLFWAFMIVIFLNILFGIIIDTFAELRDDKSKKEEDMHTKCFICGIDSYTFDRYGEGFEKHVKQEHNMWAYLYFIHHLRRKDKNDYTGQESYVADLVEKGDIAFFPAGKARSINKVIEQAAEEDGDADGSAPTTSAGATVASRGGSGGSGGDPKASARGDRPLSARGDGEDGAAVDPAMLAKIMAKLDQLSAAQQQQQQQQQVAVPAPNSSPANLWLSKIADVSRKAMANRRREDSPTQQAGAESPGSAGLTPSNDSISIREHKQRVDSLQAAADKARETATTELKEAFVLAVNRLGELLARQARLAEEAQNATIEAYAMKSAILVDAVSELNRRAAERAVAAEKQTNLLSLELDGLRAMRESERKKRLGADSTRYADSLQGLMKEGENYIQLLRSAVREGRTHTSSPSRVLSSPETN